MIIHFCGCMPMLTNSTSSILNRKLLELPGSLNLSIGLEGHNNGFCKKKHLMEIAALFVAAEGLRQPQVGDGDLVEGGHYDAAGDPFGDGLTAVL